MTRREDAPHAHASVPSNLPALNLTPEPLVIPDHLLILERAALYAHALHGTDEEDDALLAAHILALREWAALRRWTKRTGRGGRTSLERIERALVELGGIATTREIAHKSKSHPHEAGRLLRRIAIPLGRSLGMDNDRSGSSRIGSSTIWHLRVLRPGVA